MPQSLPSPSCPCGRGGPGPSGPTGHEEEHERLLSRQVLTSNCSLISSPTLTQARHSFPPWIPRSMARGSTGTTLSFSEGSRANGQAVGVERPR